MYLSQIEEKDFDKLTEKQKSDIVYGDMTDFEGKADVALLLGGPSDECEIRAVAAAELYNSGRVPYIIPSGGVCRDSEFGYMNEARIMGEYLKKAGVPEERIIYEEQATTTKENMLFGAVMILRNRKKCPVSKVAVVTSAYHMMRSMRIAKCFIPRQFEPVPFAAHSDGDDRDGWMKTENGIDNINGEIKFLRRDILVGVAEDMEIK